MIMKKKQCSQCLKSYGANSFDGGNICAKCISWNQRKKAQLDRYIERYQDLTQHNGGLDIRLQKRAYEIVIEFGSIADAAKQLKVNRGIIHRVMNGHDSPMLREKLGVELLEVSVRPCSCGEVHTLKNCPHAKKKRKQFRRAASFESEERLELFDEMLLYYQSTLTDWMNSSLDYYLDKHRHKNQNAKVSIF